MKISRDWLGDFIDWIESDPQVIADRMTRGMGEVEEVTLQGAIMDRVVVGKILTLGKHPNADKLSVCTIQTDDGVKHVVCGGTNLSQDMLVAFAHVGASVKAGGKEMLTLSKVKIRGEESEGMICAAEELEIESLYPPKPEDGARPVVNLTAAGFKPGTPLRKALGMDDVIFHVDNHAITNRPDLFSHIGIARELVAMGLATWKKEPAMAAIKFPATAPTFTLKNDAEELVPFYNAAVLGIESVQESPEWMQRRLTAVGWRPINLVVDITNYVLMEVGMPLHAFDADDFKGDLHIRAAKKGEKITTLDNVQRQLPEGAIIISDDNGIFDLFGVMGGLRSSTKPTTRRIFLQAGIPDPAAVRKTVIAMSHRTDAATVYEKGVLPITANMGLRRAIELFLQLSPGAKVLSKPVTWGKAANPKAVKLPAARISEFIGTAISAAVIKKILTDLGCDVKTAGTTVTVTPPAWRRDLNHAQDVIEEVARVYGYANIPPVMPDSSIVPPDRDMRVAKIRDSLSGSGAFEMLHLAFTNPAQLKRWNMDPHDAVGIENPIGEELSLMRPSLIPAIIETAAREFRNTEAAMLKTYEIGHVFRKGDEHPGCTYAVLARGKTTVKDAPLLVAKTDILRALKAAGYDAEVREGAVPLPGVAHEGRSAEISVNGALVGHLFELHPALQASLGLPGRTAVATVGLHRLLTLPAHVTLAKPLPMFPSVTFDETLPLGAKTSHAAAMKALKAIDPLLESIDVADLYEKDALRTITLRFTYRAKDRTLTQEEVEKIHAKVLAELKKA